MNEISLFQYLQLVTIPNMASKFLVINSKFLKTVYVAYRTFQFLESLHATVFHNCFAWCKKLFITFARLGYLLQPVIIYLSKWILGF